jgi:hypothetical protein
MLNKKSIKTKAVPNHVFKPPGACLLDGSSPSNNNNESER